MFKNLKWLKGLDVMENVEKMNDGILSNRLSSLFTLAQNVQSEFELIDEKTTIYHRKKALEEHNLSLTNYQNTYLQIAEQLELYTPNTRTLLDFIVEWAVRDPFILLGLAEKISLTQDWHKIPENRPKKTRR